MNARLGRTAAIVLVGILVSPGLAYASLWDLIWKMSGPQMSGFPLHCEWAFGDKTSDETRALRAKGLPGLNDTRSECRFFDYRFTGLVKARSQRRAWFSLDTAPYFSTGKNPDGSDNPDYEAFKIWMVAAEPILEMRSGSWKDGNITLDHGVLGATYNIFFGDGFDTFDKAGLKFKPVVVTLARKVNFSATVRWYPNGITPDEFGLAPPRPDDDRPNEWVYGLSFGYLW